MTPLDRLGVVVGIQVSIKRALNYAVEESEGLALSFGPLDLGVFCPCLQQQFLSTLYLALADNLLTTWE